jgi:hypothetical protein
MITIAMAVSIRVKPWARERTTRFGKALLINNDIQFNAGYVKLGRQIELEPGHGEKMKEGGRLERPPCVLPAERHYLTS